MDYDRKEVRHYLRLNEAKIKELLVEAGMASKDDEVECTFVGPYHSREPLDYTAPEPGYVQVKVIPAKS